MLFLLESWLKRLVLIEHTVFELSTNLICALMYYYVCYIMLKGNINNGHSDFQSNMRFKIKHGIFQSNTNAGSIQI